jgi:hypothetical protein
VSELPTGTLTFLFKPATLRLVTSARGKPLCDTRSDHEVTSQLMHTRADPFSLDWW